MADETSLLTRLGMVSRKNMAIIGIGAGLTAAVVYVIQQILFEKTALQKRIGAGKEGK